jgi:hypothetical protein
MEGAGYHDYQSWITLRGVNGMERKCPAFGCGTVFRGISKDDETQYEISLCRSLSNSYVIDI